MQEVSIHELESLPPHLSSAVALYLFGCDLRKIYRGGSYWRKKKALRELGFDITRVVENPRKAYTTHIDRVAVI